MTPAEHYNYEEFLRAQEIRAGVLRINQGIDEDTAAIWLSEIDRIRLNPEVSTVELRILSPGGDVYVSLGLYDAIRSLTKAGKKIRATVEGMAASAAAMIVLQAADERLATPHSRILVHEARRWVMAIERASDMEDGMSEMRALTEVVTQLMAERCGKTKEDVTAFITRREVWLSAQEALDWGLLDGIIG